MKTIMETGSIPDIQKKGVRKRRMKGKNES